MLPWTGPNSKEFLLPWHVACTKTSCSGCWQRGARGWQGGSGRLRPQLHRAHAHTQLLTRGQPSGAC